MDAVSYANSAKQAQRIKKFINEPDSTSGIVTVPKVIASGETITIPSGRVAVLPNTRIDGVLNVDGEVFIPSGSTLSTVVEKVTSTDNAIVRFNGATGEVQNSNVIIDDVGTLTVIASQNAATLGVELVTNGGFTGNATGWTLGASWAYSTNALTCTLGGSVEGTVSQNVNVVLDNYYLLEWAQTNTIDTNAHITPSLGAVIGGRHSSGTTNVTFQQMFRATATGSLPLTFTVTDITSTGQLWIDAISLKQVLPIKPSMILPSATAGNRMTEIRTTWNGINSPNIGIGAGALQSNTTGYANTASGVNALPSNTTGYWNTANGAGALQSNTTGYANTASGVNALPSNTTGYQNTANGASALYSNTTGYWNTASGVNALSNNTTGYSNTANGAGALYSNTTGNSNTASGVNALSNNTTYSNVSGLGYNSQVTASNQVQLGDSATTTYVYGTVQNRSDIRDKADIRDTVLGLDFIQSLRPVDYKWDMREDYKPERPDIEIPDESDENYEELKAKYDLAMEEWLESCKLENIVRDGSKKRTRYHQGFIAQEVLALGMDFGGIQDHSVRGGEDVLSIGYDEIIAPLVKAVQEQQAMIEALKARIEILEGAK